MNKIPQNFQARQLWQWRSDLKECLHLYSTSDKSAIMQQNTGQLEQWMSNLKECLHLYFTSDKSAIITQQNTGALYYILKWAHNSSWGTGGKPLSNAATRNWLPINLLYHIEVAFLPKQTDVRHYPKRRKLTSRDHIFTLANSIIQSVPKAKTMLPHWCSFLLSFQSLCWELKLKFSPSCCLQLYKLSDSYLSVFKDSACRAERQMKLQHVACTLS